MSVVLSKRKGYTKKKTCNGCGSSSNAWLVPDRILWLSIKEACCIHDDRYTEKVTISGKNMADREFKNNLLRLIQATPWYYPKTLARAVANRYYRAVSDFGGPAFWDTVKINKVRGK